MLPRCDSLHQLLPIFLIWTAIDRSIPGNEMTKRAWDRFVVEGIVLVVSQVLLVFVDLDSRMWMKVLAGRLEVEEV